MSDIIHESFVMDLGKTWPLISIEKLKEVFEEHEADLPEQCFLRELMDDLEDAEDDVNPCTQCSTSNDDDAKFCKECGVALDQEEEKTTIADLDWYGDGAAETFESIFIKKVVPLITGTIEAGFLYGDPDDQNTPWMGAFFVIRDGKLNFVHPDMERMAQAPTFAIDDEE